MRKIQVTETQKEMLEGTEAAGVLVATILAIGVAVFQAANMITEVEKPNVPGQEPKV